MSDRPHSGRRITLADVAREAGVSVQTASHVLSGNVKVRLPETTRQRVRLAADKVGYRPNRIAQAMKLGKTRMISVWMPVDRIAPNYMRFLQAINAHARENDYDLMITGLDGSVALSAKGRAPYSWPVDGVFSIDAGKAIQFFRDDPANDHVPVIVLGLEQFTNSDSVSWDVIEAAREATNRLIQRGCRRIVHLTLDWVLKDFPREQRRRGYGEAMEEAGLEPIFLPVGSESSSSAESLVMDYIGANGIPDAFFGFTDPLAIGAARAVLLKGARIPEDCLIWGFGDYPESEDFKVPISTIRAPIQDLVAQGWTWLMERLEHPEIDPRLVMMAMTLVERASTQRP